MTSLRQFATMVLRDVRLIYLNPTALALLLVLPLVLIAVTSQAFDFLLGARSIDLIVVDLDRSERSEQLVGELRDMDAVDVIVKEWTREDFGEADAEDLFAGRDQFAALVVPAGYGRQDASSDAAPLRFYVDPIQAGLASIVRERVEHVLFLDELTRRVANEVAGEDAGDGSVRVVILGAVDSLPIRVDQELGAEGQGFPSAFEQSVPGFAVMFGFWLAGFIALTVYTEKSVWGTWLRTVAAPVPRTLILASKITSYVLLGLAQLTILFGLGVLFWDVTLGDSLLALALTMVAISLVSACFGLAVNAWIRDNTLGQQQVINLSVIVLAAIGGALVPVFLLPNWIAAVSPATPHFWALSAMQDVMFRGQGVVDVLLPLSVLLAFAAAFFTAALLRFRFVD